MKHKFYFILLITITITQCKPKDNDAKIKEIKTLLKEIDLDAFNNYHQLVEIADSSSQLKFDKSDKEIFDLFFEGEPVDIGTVRRMTMPLDSQTQYLYFYKQDFDELFSSDTCSRQRGVRIYLYQYPKAMKLHSDTTKLHPNRGMNTVVLRSMCGNDTINSIKFPHALYNFGDLCPKICNNTDKKGDRTPLEVKDGVPPKSN